MHSAEDLLSDNAVIARAAALLRAGALVALPSETVYGLAADATQDDAVAAIYTAKGRPDFNPLIVHLPDLDSAITIADFPGAARALADAFWPGPLTLVLPLKPGQAPFTIPVTDSGKAYRLRVTVGGRESVKTGIGTLPAIKLTLNASEVNGKAAEASNLTLWLSDDARRIPLKYTAGLAVGSFQLTLAKAVG